MWRKSLGIGLIQGWLWLFFLNGPLLYETTLGLLHRTENVFLAFLLFNCLSYMVITKTNKRFFPPGKKPLLIFILMTLMSVGTLMTGFAVKDTGLFFYKLLVISGAASSAVGAAMLISAWGERFSTLSAHRASLAFGLAVAVGTASFFIIRQFPTPLAIIITACLPLISIFLLMGETKLQSVPDKTTPTRSSSSFPFPAKLVALILLFYLTGGLMYKIIASGRQLGFFETYWLTNIVYLAVCLSAGAIVYLNPNLDLRFLYRPILPLLGIGFIVFPVLHNSYPVVPFTFLQSGFALFDLYTWILFVYLAARHQSPIKVIAWGMFLITAAIFAGELLFTATSSVIGAAMDEIEFVSLLAALLMFAGTLIFRGEAETFAGWASPVSDNAESQRTGSEAKSTPYQITEENSVIPINENDPALVTTKETKTSTRQIDKPQELNKPTSDFLPSEAFANHYNLTPREKQVLELLLEGRNNPYIREDLNVSNNTLKTHLRNIYRKLSISDRQELLDLYKAFKDNS